MESSFAGVDFGSDKGMHLTTQMLESLGQDLLRTLLIYTSLYVPPELRDTFKYKQPQGLSKQFTEDVPDHPALSITEMIMAELSENKNLIKIGNGDSSSGSDSAPSEDNLNPAELLKNLPVTDKIIKNKLKQIEIERKSPSKIPQKDVRVTTKPKETPVRVKQDSFKSVKPSIQPNTVKVVEQPTAEQKKVKPEMRDAVTQTDRSDWSLIKAKLAREKLEKEVAA